MCILRSPFEAILGHFSTFSLIVSIQQHVDFAGVFFTDFSMDNLPHFDIKTVQKHSEYCGFREVSFFPGKGAGPGFSLSALRGSGGRGHVGDTAADFLNGVSQHMCNFYSYFLSQASNLCSKWTRSLGRFYS